MLNLPVVQWEVSPTPSTGPVPQLDMESASNMGGRVSGQVAAIEKLQGEETDSLTVQQNATLVQNDLLTRRLHQGTRVCTPEDISIVLKEVLESMGVEIAGSGIEFSDLQVQFLLVGKQLEIDLPQKLQQWLMNPTNHSDFLWLYNVLLDPKWMLELLEGNPTPITSNAQKGKGDWEWYNPIPPHPESIYQTTRQFKHFKTRILWRQQQKSTKKGKGMSI
ncbi:hypothetical protein EV359DRAFT_68079 [Lentinula novae-zelandiae]|nr:hypothetical protein EV359DRAFT_68079 [Lentinula novae-zelandiae]